MAEQDTQNLVMEHRLFVQKQEDTNKDIYEKLESITKDVTALKAEEKENDLFHDRIMTIWKVLGIVVTVIASTIGTLYMLGKDIGFIHH